MSSGCRRIVNGIIREMSELITQEGIAIGSSNLVEGLTTWPAMYDHWPRSKGQRRSQATFDLSVSGGLYRRFCGVRLRRVCMLVSLSQFWSRNQLALSIALTVHYSPAVSRNRALT